MEIGRRITLGVAGWLVPGSGHFLRGERRKGVLFGITLLGCFIAGEVMAEFRAVSKREHGIAYWAQIGSGATTFLFDLYDARYNQAKDAEEARERRRKTASNPGPRASKMPVPVPRLLDCGIAPLIAN